MIGREGEVERVIRILSRKTKNNPVLVGEPGVGKTAIAEGLAQRIVAGEVPEVLRDKRVLSLDLGGLVAGTGVRGEFEQRVQRVLEELRARGARHRVRRRDAHPGRRGCGAGRDRRLEPPQARARPRRAAVPGRHHARRVPRHIEKDAALERRSSRSSSPSRPRPRPSRSSAACGTATRPTTA